MRVLESPAIVLQVTNLQERDRIVTFLTGDHGQKRGVARGARTKFSRFQGLQPLAEIEVRWVEKSGRDLVRIGEVSVSRGAHRRPASLESVLTAQYVAESVERFTVEDEPAHLEMRLLRAVSRALEEGVDWNVLLRYFEVWLLHLAGIFSLDGLCPRCGRAFDGGAVLADDADSLVCRTCAAETGAEGRLYDGETLAWIRACASARPRQPPPASEAVLRRVEDLALEVRRRFLGHPLRSYEVMQQALGSL